MTKTSSIVVLLASLTCNADTPKADAAQQEMERQQGIWHVTSFVWNGKESPVEVVNTITREMDGDHVIWKRNGKSFAGTTIELDPGVEPKAIDVLPDGGRCEAAECWASTSGTGTS